MLIRRGSPEGRVKAGRPVGADPAEVLAFWFSERDATGAIRFNAEWFAANPAFDAEVHRRFAALHERAAAGTLAHWSDTWTGLRALIIVLDQFSRQLYRQSPKAFACDPLARQLAQKACNHPDFGRLSALEQLFVLLPFEHSESLADQDFCVEQMANWATDPGLAVLLEHAEQHRELIRRFGRFPARNAVLGRMDTPDELAFRTAKSSETGKPS
ncbi:DUF924 family protein [Chitinilyticum piscinae]|uniref:DUF924 domain-containing protein n=1 Tax=Chitinilyticum piscinae TaxID=2866724 RepID=A0A8J7G115_9NEIS|nr:DUF924 family protein [Chitinilyticum piscinae]MBE9609428.1 DUF924 domain-containing protein [Chitinilyticum piscinae]